MKVIKSRSFKVNVSLIIIYFVLLFSINNNLGLISFLIYSFLLVNVTLIKYILYSFKNKQWSIYYLIYVVTLFISYQQSKYWMVIPAFQFFLIGIVYSILFIAKYFYPLLRAEYETAKIEKQLNINEYIIKTVSKKFLGIKKIEIINQLKIQNRKEKYILNQETGFKDMLLKTRLSAETKEEVLVRYEDEVLDNHKISSIVGNVILKRNQNNLLIALIFLAFVLTLEITLFKFNYVHNDFLNVFKESIYIMIFYKVNVEICRNRFSILL